MKCCRNTQEIMYDVQQWLFVTVGNQLVDEGGREGGYQSKSPAVSHLYSRR